MSEITEIEIKSMTKEQNYMRGYEDGKNDVLDKIRTEIEEHVKINQNLNTERAKALCWCLNVIDKYKAESEDKE